MKFQTAITHITPEGERIRGYELAELAQQNSFSRAIWLLLRGEMPTVDESKMFSAILTMAIDHGPGTASGQVARIVASAKTSIQAAVAAGILAMGERHVAALESAAAFFVANQAHSDVAGLIKDLKDKKVRIPGYGHAVLTDDKRSTTLLNFARELKLYGQYAAFAEKVRQELNQISSKPLPLNIDGAMAAILLDLGFSPQALTGVFLIARTPGLVAQATEEMTNDVGLRRLPEENIEYTGPAPRKLA